jgi:hypothetical protein
MRLFTGRRERRLLVGRWGRMERRIYKGLGI